MNTHTTPTPLSRLLLFLVHKGYKIQRSHIDGSYIDEYFASGDYYTLKIDPLESTVRVDDLKGPCSTITNVPFSAVIEHGVNEELFDAHMASAWMGV